MKAYDIFLSYIHQEEDTASYIKQYLERWFEHRVEVFVARQNIASGEEWFRAVRRSIEMADTVLVLCSPFSVNSPWVNFEIGFAWGQAKTVIPLCHRHITSGQLPDTLRTIQALEINTEDDVEELVRRIAEKSGVAPSAKDVATFVRNLPDQGMSSAEIYVAEVLSTPSSYDAISALTTALQEGKRDGILTSAHLVLGLLSLKRSLLRRVVSQDGTEVADVEQAIRSSIQPLQSTGDVHVTSAVRQTMGDAVVLARQFRVLLDQIHVLSTVFEASGGLSKHLRNQGFKVDLWRNRLESLVARKLSTPYQELE